eukprot:5309477-Amphidinium_carterae.1
MLLHGVFKLLDDIAPAACAWRQLTQTTFRFRHYDCTVLGQVTVVYARTMLVANSKGGATLGCICLPTALVGPLMRGRMPAAFEGCAELCESSVCLDMLVSLVLSLHTCVQLLGPLPR